jgi:hypothetical protein
MARWRRSIGCWASWLSRQTFNLEIHGFKSRIPYHVPFVQWIRTERYERSDPSSNLGRDTKFQEVVAERQRHFTVYEDQVGSTPIHFAKV